MAFEKVLLLPLSFIYGIVTGSRNLLFHIGVLKSKRFDVPVLCVGNITVGGTGKTPHTELIIAELQKKFRVACLSRGYKRKTSGFVLAGEHSTAREIGDEPMQIKKKFPHIIVACDADRVRGIEKLLALPEPPQVIVLDDAFQHRYVQADKNIVLVDYNRPVYQDMLLPAGRLRENTGALKRADYIIVTKCPPGIQPIERRILSKHLKIKPYQQLYFTSMEYGSVHKLSTKAKDAVLHRDSSILCVTGIARPEPYVEHLKTFTEHVTELRFPDHHFFTGKDIQRIGEAFEALGEKEKYIFTTEKDAVRLAACNLPEELKRHIYYIPIVPDFIQKECSILKELSEYVRKNQR